ncbi:MAG: S8 family serine peptidase [Dehalococcoidales bacterium]|nr:S8 family serine peptidase [Dehalococcoidales bacterium]
MRYAIIPKGLTLSQIEEECLKLGARNMRKAQLLEQVFCELETEAISKLKAIPGIEVKELKDFTTHQVMPPPQFAAPPVYAASQGSMASLWWQTRAMMDPPITGDGLTVAVLDTGIHKTHLALAGKVIHEANFTDSLDCEDRFDHGTGVAYLIAGGRHALGEESGIAPGVNLMNIKVLNDEGIGSTESVILGLEEVCRLQAEAEAAQLAPWEPMYPNIVNMSLGAPDDGDPDNPIRLACRKAAGEPYWLGLVAAAGNSGPDPSSITIPATDPYVFAVGAVTFSPYQVWEHSSRGPTKEGLTKPDLVFFGVDILTASCKSDSAYAVKSGTSFASAFICGEEAIIFEMLRRITGQAYPNYSFALEFLREGTPQLCKKPYDAPPEQDNDYGWGQPFGDLAIQSFQPKPAVSMSDMGSLLGLGLMSSLASGLFKAMR